MQLTFRPRSTRGPEGVRFELTRPFGLPVFKTGAINRSATPPGALRPTVVALYERRKLWEKLAKGIHRPL
jgi:hypothetical protein